MKFAMIALIIVVALTIANITIAVLDYRQRAEHTAFLKETGELTKKWEAEDKARPFYELREGQLYYIKPLYGEWTPDNDLEVFGWDGSNWVPLEAWKEDTE